MDDDLDDAMHMRPIQDEQDDVMITDDVEPTEPPAAAAAAAPATATAESTLSPSSSLTSGTDVYMDAVDILHDDQQNDQSGTPEIDDSVVL